MNTMASREDSLRKHRDELDRAVSRARATGRKIEDAARQRGSKLSNLFISVAGVASGGVSQESLRGTIEEMDKMNGELANLHRRMGNAIHEMHRQAEVIRVLRQLD